MLRSTLRWAIPLGALFLLGPLAGWLTFTLRAPDGSPDTTLVLSEAGALGLLRGVGVLALGLAAGLAGAWLNDVRNGLFSAGLVMAWGAWGLGRVDRVLARVGHTSALYSIALEAVVLALAAVACAWLIMRTPQRAWAAPDPHRHHHHPEPPARWEIAALPAMGAAAVAGAVVVWFLAADTLKGQTVAAAVFGGLGAATVGRMTFVRASGLMFVGAIALLAIAGPIAAATAHGASAPDLARAGRLLPLARPLPLDWVAGAFIGVPLGLSWAASMVDKKK